jgi:serine/threonine-protein kinase HipA
MLRAWLHGVHVGDLRVRAGGRWDFRFDPTYLLRAERPVLGRWFEDQNLSSLTYGATQGYLPAFFQNYLPEVGSSLRELLAHRAGVDPKRNGPLLAVLGEDLPGAVVVREVDDDLEPGDETPLTDSHVSSRTALRFSLAGMQLKFSVLLKDSRYTLPVTGRGGRWIAKLPDPQHPSVPEHESAMLTLAAKVGIVVPEHCCIPWRSIDGLPEELALTERDALVVRRYDRADDGTRIHQEDFAQVFNLQPYNKYNDVERAPFDATFRGIGRVIAAVCGHDDFFEYVRRMVFMVLTGNHDAHLKNWSLLYPDRRLPRLAPAYDLLSTVTYVPSQRGLALRFFRCQRFDEVRRADFEALAERARMDSTRTLQVVDETIERFMKIWEDKSSHPGLPTAARVAIAQHLTTLPLIDPNRRASRRPRH